MIFSKVYRIILIPLFLISILAIIFLNYDFAFQIGFIILSGIIFMLDFKSVSAGHGRLTLIRVLERKWHFIAILSQWLFLGSLVYIPFIISLTLIYKIVMIVVLFVLLAFTYYKFENQPII